MTEPKPERLVRFKEVQDRTGLKRSTIYRLISEGHFPKPLRPAYMRISVWPESVLAAWIEDQIARSRERQG